jgi:hypothetical protein
VSQSVERTALAAISAVERRDGQSLSSLYAPDIVFEWLPGLPYSGVYRGDAVLSMHEVFAADTSVFAHYSARDRQLTLASMYYFDLLGVRAFLDRDRT